MTLALPTSACKHCSRQIAWVRTVNGNAMPIDPEPFETGNVFVAMVNGHRVARVATKADPRPPGIAFRTHLQTCPNNPANRKKGVSTVHADPPPLPATTHRGYVVACDLCGEPLDVRATGVHQWTAGWVKQRTGGGGHAVSCPVRERRWAHESCVERAATGHDGQDQLFP